MPELWSSRESGLVRTFDWFNYAGYKVRDMREPLRETRDIIRAAMQEQFDTEGDRSGNPWVPLNEDYALWKEMHAPGEPMLRLTREMHGIVMAEDSWDITVSQARFRPPSEKAGWHQLGVPERHGGGRHHNKPNPLPARPFLDITDADYALIEDAFYRWFDELRDAHRDKLGGAPFPQVFQ